MLEAAYMFAGAAVACVVMLPIFVLKNERIAALEDANGLISNDNRKLNARLQPFIAKRARDAKGHYLKAVAK